LRIILSRKGFDTGNGGVPSPIFPDGRMVTLPIPRKSRLRYRDISSPKPEFHHLGEIVEQLTRFRMSDSCCVHLDPDLDSNSITHDKGWRGIFGQSGNAQRELEKAGVKEGVEHDSLFLFFGQFCRVEMDARGQLRYVKGSPIEQVIFGWLRVGKIYRLPEEADHVPSWAQYHPHFHLAEIEKSPNVIYIAAEKLDVSGEVSGWGVFRYLHNDLRLTHPVPVANKKGKLVIRASRWQLPAWMYPWKDKQKPRTPLTHHRKPQSWAGSDDNGAILQTQGIGQEFVLYANEYPEAWPWAMRLIENCTSHAQERPRIIAGP